MQINEYRCRRLIKEAIKTFNLDLSGLIILTEAATGYYVLTPLIAALAGAEKVYGLTRDSRYGNALLVEEQTLAIAQRWSVSHKIEVLFSREDERISYADVVTNLGFVRPLDDSLLRRLKKTAVIPLMFETWEFRSEDLDLKTCRELDIPVLGMNENHPDLEIFKYVGHLALKLLFEIDIEVIKSRILVIGGGEFGKAVRISLQAAGATVYCVNGEAFYKSKQEHILRKCDAVVVVEHQFRGVLLGQSGQMTARELKSLNSGIALIHIAGNIDQKNLEDENLMFVPSRIALPGYMSVATDYLGPKPLIDLHVAGLKVGESLARERLLGSDGSSSKKAVLAKSSFAQDFVC